MSPHVHIHSLPPEVAHALPGGGSPGGMATARPLDARRAHVRAACTLTASLLAACSSVPLPPLATPVRPPLATAPVARAEPPVTPPTAPPAAVATPEMVQSGATAISGTRVSSAANPRAYREDAATHLYGLNRERIYKGRMPPLLYAVGVLQVEVDGAGQVRKLDWMRAPSHAPEVVREIERTVRAAAPFPAPVRMGRVVYTDTWLWHKSGRFQLDTLTEGQD